MSQHPLSIQLYTVREAIAEDLDAALARIAGIGFRTVELYGFVDRAAEYADLLSKHGLRASSAHASLLDGDTDAILAAAKTAGVPTLIEPGTRERWDSIEGVQWLAAMMNARAEAAVGTGIRVGYHNHWWELGQIGGRPALEIFAESLSPEVVLEVDTYWTQVAGADAIDTLQRLGDRVQFIHVKDGPIEQEAKTQVAVGSGSMPVLDILAAAPQAVPVVELDDTEGDMFAALEDSFAFLTANGQRA